MRVKRLALAATLAIMLAASLTFWKDPTPCYEAYFASGLAQQHVSFHEFHELYKDEPCETDDSSTEEAEAGLLDAHDGDEE